MLRPRDVSQLPSTTVPAESRFNRALYVQHLGSRCINVRVCDVSRRDFVTGWKRHGFSLSGLTLLKTYFYSKRSALSVIVPLDSASTYVQFESSPFFAKHCSIALSDSIFQGYERVTLDFQSWLRIVDDEVILQRFSFFANMPVCVLSLCHTCNRAYLTPITCPPVRRPQLMYISPIL